MPTGLMVHGTAVPIVGLAVSNWQDDPGLRLSTKNFRPRSDDAWVHLIVLHTTRGIPGGNDKRQQVIRNGLGPFTDAGHRHVRAWNAEPRAAGAHLVVDFDGTISCCSDLGSEAAYHAGAVNGCSVGIEIVQGPDAELYEGQLEIAVRLVDALTVLFGIQRQIPHRYLGPIPRFARPAAPGSAQFSDAVGVLGHRDVSTNRGLGDPGNAIFNRLGLAGYEPVDYANRAEIDTWRTRQAKVGISSPDGIPGPRTRAALEAAGYPRGMWVSRPGDALAPTIDV